MTTKAKELKRPLYLHGAEASEQARLETQARLLGGAEFLPRLSPGMQVLDVGCGTGAIAREVAAKVTPGQVVGVDREVAQLTAARSFAGDLANLRFEQANVLSLPFSKNTFDGVYCRFLLEHVADPMQAVSEMVRVVKPGGWVCALEWEPDTIVNYPDSPVFRQIWQAIYALQASLGADPWIGRKLYSLFGGAGLKRVRAMGRIWTVTAAQSENLRLYVGGAREIIRQTREQLLAARLTTEEVLEAVDQAYAELLVSPDTFIIHAFCRASGRKASKLT